MIEKKLARKRNDPINSNPYRAWKRMRQEEHQDDGGDAADGEEW